MIELRVANVPVEIHPLMVLLPVLGMSLGPNADLAALLVSLVVHEAGHLAASRLSGVRVERVMVMPFGCGIQLGNLYALSPGHVLAVSVAGPLASSMLLLADGALAHWGLLPSSLALSLLKITLALLLFNLLPALPLDGGRMLYAMTVKPLGRDRAVLLGASLGYLTAFGLMLCSVIAGFRIHRINVTLMACAAFILKGIQEDRRALRDVRISSMLNVLKRTKAIVPLRLCAVDESLPILSALRHAVPNTAMLYAIYHGEQLTGFVDEREIMRFALMDASARVCDLQQKCSPVA